MIKKLVLIITCIICFSGCASMKVNICGIDVNEMKGKDFGVALVGAVASLATHVTGHYIAAEICDVDIHQDGFNEIIDYSNNPSSSDIRWMARGGFLFQHIINSALIKYANDSYFTKGFTAFTCTEVLTYGLIHTDDGDFNLIDEAGGSGDFEYAIFGLWSAYNFYKISVKKNGNS